MEVTTSYVGWTKVSFRGGIWTQNQVLYVVVILTRPGIATYDRDGAARCVLRYITQLQPLE